MRTLITLNIVLFLLGCSYRRGELIPQIDGLYGYHIPVFALFLFLSYLAANYFLQRAVRQENWPAHSAETFLLIAVAGGIVGAKLFFILESYEDWWGKPGFWQNVRSPGGMTWYGGFLLAAAGILLAARWFKIRLGSLADNLVPAVAIGYAIGRLGCALSGDGCYGIPCPDVVPAPFCMSFPNGVADWSEMIRRYGNPYLKVYNTPLFESLFALGSGATIWFRYRRNRGDGSLMLRFILAHACFRFFIEFLRLNPRNVFGISQAQFISLLLAVTSTLLLFWLKRRSNGGGQ